MPDQIPILIPFSALKSYGIDLSRDTIRRLARAGRFPAPVRVGGHRIAWRLNEIEQWLAELPVAGPRVRRAKRTLVARVSMDRVEAITKTAISQY